MTQTYNLDWAINKYQSHPDLKFLYFWGHTSKSNGQSPMPVLVNGMIRLLWWTM